MTVYPCTHPQGKTSREEGPSARNPATHDGLVRDILSTEELATLYAPLSRDYRAALLMSAGLGFRDRSRVIRLRLDAYAAALTEALDAAKNDATVVLRGPRSWWGR